MAMISDRDLVVLEPAVFTAAGDAAATRLVAADDALVSGASLSSASSDFAAGGVEAGHVGVLSGVAIEVLGRAGSIDLEVSLPRAAPTDDAIAPTPGGAQTLAILTFARLIERKQAELLASLGRDPDERDQPLAASRIVNADEIAGVLARQCVAAAFETAAAAEPGDASLAARASLWKRLASAATERAQALIDLNGDGIADAARHPRVAAMRRS